MVFSVQVVLDAKCPWIILEILIIRFIEFDKLAKSSEKINENC